MEGGCHQAGRWAARLEGVSILELSPDEHRSCTALSEQYQQATVSYYTGELRPSPSALSNCVGFVQTMPVVALCYHMTTKHLARYVSEFASWKTPDDSRLPSDTTHSPITHRQTTHLHLTNRLFLFAIPSPTPKLWTCSRCQPLRKWPRLPVIHSSSSGYKDEPLASRQGAHLLQLAISSQKNASLPSLRLLRLWNHKEGIDVDLQ